MKYNLPFEAQWEELAFHKAAKEAFLNLPDGKTPKVKDLNEKNEKEKMWQVQLDVPVLSGVPGRWGIIGITNIKE